MSTNPRQRALRRLRASVEPYKRRALQRIRGDVNVDRLVAQGLQLGPRVFIGQGVFLDAGHPWLISIGEDSMITAGTVVLAHDGSAKLQTGFTKIGRVSIGKRVFVGAGAVILPGATIGDDSIVGALTVVRGDVPAGSVVIGNPAMVVSDVESFAEKHRVAATHAPVWPHAGWLAGLGITESHKRARSSRGGSVRIPTRRISVRPRLSLTRVTPGIRSDRRGHHAARPSSLR